MTKYSMRKDSEKAFVEMHCAEVIPQDSMIYKKKTSLKQVDTTIHQDIFLNGKRLHESLIQNITVCAYHMFNIK